MPTLTILVGPPGSGKSTLANELNASYVNQDLQKEQHLEVFNRAIIARDNIVVDRMNFNKKQRERYLEPARKAGYKTKIIVLHVPKETCFSRCTKREGHPTIQDAETAKKAIHFFFKSYEKVEDNEADEVERLGWKDTKEATKCIVCDLDGTMANIEHRLYHVRDTTKPNWKGFFEDMVLDGVNRWCDEIITQLSDKYPIVYATGRPADYWLQTSEWLSENGLTPAGSRLFMREAGDFRKDSVIKQNILDFEIKTRYDILFVIDDRQQVVDMWRDNGYTVLQCAKGDF